MLIIYNYICEQVFIYLLSFTRYRTQILELFHFTGPQQLATTHWKLLANLILMPKTNVST